MNGLIPYTFAFIVLLLCGLFTFVLALWGGEIIYWKIVRVIQKHYSRKKVQRL